MQKQLLIYTGRQEQSIGNTNMPSDLIFCSPTSEDLWNQMMDLRFEVLRKPWGEPKGSEQADDDEKSIHGIIVNHENQVIGTCRCHLNSENEAQFRFMAIDAKFQGKGLGKLLVQYMENLIKETYPGVNKIILHSREPAVPFYLAMNYKIVSTSYLLFGVIQHFLMEKSF